MKIALVSAAAAVVTATSASAFVPSASFARSASSLRSSVAVVDGDSSATVTSDDDIYEKIGFAKDNVALGIDANEVYEYLGGREELIAKFQKDCPHFDTARASLEVDKFLMMRKW